jgi:hypothetical protein
MTVGRRREREFLPNGLRQCSESIGVSNEFTAKVDRESKVYLGAEMEAG